MKTIFQVILLLVGSIVVSHAQESTEYAIAERHTIYSNILEEDREIFIHKPEGFWGLDESFSCYPLTIVLDGESQFQNTVSVTDYLSAAPFGNDFMPRTIVVGIPNTNRVKDFTPIKGMIGNVSTSLNTTGGGRKFLDFITTELIPHLDSLYSLCEHRTIIGHSLGGLIVFEALLNKREYFNNYLAIDPTLDFADELYLSEIIDTLETATLHEEHLYVASASAILDIIGVEDIEEETAEIVQLFKSSRKLLRKSNEGKWSIKFSQKDYVDETHFSIPYIATSDALREFYSYYPFKQIMKYYHPKFNHKTDLVKKLQNHFEVVSDRLGFKAIPMESYINSWAFGLSQFGRIDLAIDMFRYSTQLYPKNPSAYNTMGYFMMNNDKEEEAIKLFEKSLSIQESKDIREEVDKLKSKFRNAK